MKKLYVIGYYRQWQVINLTESGNISKQNIRVDNPTKLWERMISENPNTEIIISWDFNINSLIWRKKRWKRNHNIW